MMVIKDTSVTPIVKQVTVYLSNADLEALKDGQPLVEVVDNIRYLVCLT